MSNIILLGECCHYVKVSCIGSCVAQLINGISVRLLDSRNDKWICSPVRSWRINSCTCCVVCSWTESVAGWHYWSPACNLQTVKLAFGLPHTAGICSSIWTALWQPIKMSLRTLLTLVRPTDRQALWDMHLIFAKC